jgi:two-component system NtrC family sensor kinase
MNGIVLIVDDSLTVRMDLTDALEAAGFRTLPCATLAEARAALARGQISLAILDVVLPDGDGVDLLREIRLRADGVRVIMLSSEAEVSTRIRALQIGADDYVGKPYDLTYVIARARELLTDATSAPIARASVLVIDDSPTFREALRDALEAAGYSVVLAATGEEGLRLAASNRPAAVLVDGILPGLDGAGVIRKIRLDAALRDTPCILFTSTDDKSTEFRALDAGADAFVRKEDDLDLILARLAAVLRAVTAERVDTASLFGPKRILAVDDSPTYLQEVASLLRGEGYDVVLCRSGEEAIELLSVQTVDCILLDLMMPGLGGKETCRRIKASPVVRDIPLIVLTSLDDRASMLEGLGSGADDYISKSAEFEVLSVRVRAQMRRKQFEDEHRRIRDELLKSELVTMEERAARKLADTRGALVVELERKNKELEVFSYSVSHDLRAPLRAMDGFSRLLLEDYGPQLDDRGRDYLRRIRDGASRMGELIDDLLKLSRINSTELRRETIDLSDLVETVCEGLRRAEPSREVATVVEPRLLVDADRRLMRVVLENLLGNAWKFTSKVASARVEIGVEHRETGNVYFVKDNGAGFDMAHAATLFAPFRRLHRADDFPGTGIGLATVYRVVDRHGGRVWAEGAIGQGATVFFTLSGARRPSSESKWSAPTIERTS